jgi:mRNA-degrading endonuclease toxin of MazEF toxin-antitoxin module
MSRIRDTNGGRGGVEVQKRGHLYWAGLDKRRPALVVSIDARNERASDVIVIPCSTNLHAAPTHVRVGRGEGGLPRECVLKCEQITTAKNYDLDPTPLGPALTSARMAEVERAVLRAIGIPIR